MFSFLVGAQRVNSFFDNTPYSSDEPFDVKALAIHTGWSREKLLNDVAVLLLDRLVQLNETINTICLSEEDNLEVADECYLSGLAVKISAHHVLLVKSDYSSTLSLSKNFSKQNKSKTVSPS